MTNLELLAKIKHELSVRLIPGNPDGKRLYDRIDAYKDGINDALEIINELTAELNSQSTEDSP